MKQRRAYNFYPKTFKTDLNNRETYVLDDPFFEPEDFGYYTGYVGNTDLLTSEDLQRTPKLENLDVKRTIEQFQIGAVYTDPATFTKSGGSFISDLVNQIAANGGLVSDQDRLFSQRMSVWAPPVDYDKIVNFGRYFWTGSGNATTHGEYVTKEPMGSMTVVHKFSGSSFVRHVVDIVTSLPVSATNGDLVELASSTTRNIYVWDTSIWVEIIPRAVEEIPTTFDDYSVGDYVYVCRTGIDYQRPLIWKYSESAGRWIACPVCIGFNPPLQTNIGMIWEDTRILPDRKFRVFNEDGNWEDLVYTNGNPSGVVADGTLRYDNRSWTDTGLDGWAINNWWRHENDLSPFDQSAYGVGSQCLRPVIEFWNGLDANTDVTRTARNVSPSFNIYKYDETGTITDSDHNSVIASYVRGTGANDPVLGFSVVHDSGGEITIDLDLEKDETDFTGYRLFKNTQTDGYHSIWKRTTGTIYQQRVSLAESTEQPDGSFRTYEYRLPMAITVNSDHGILKELTRTKTLNHFSSVIIAQSEGSQLGNNSWRWTTKNPENGATLYDPDHSALLPLSLLQNPVLDIPESIRYISREYSRFWSRFNRQMSILWQNTPGVDGAGNLTGTVSVSDYVDVILTEMFYAKNDKFPYHYSGMGDWTPTKLSGVTVTVIDPEYRPIYVPSSAAKIGVAPTWLPETFTENGVEYLRGHDGTIIESFGDDRDDVWLELQIRMFIAVSDSFKIESETYSSRHGGNVYVQDFYGDYHPNTDKVVIDVVADHTAVVSPESARWYASRNGNVYAMYDGVIWTTVEISQDEIFYDSEHLVYYTFNGIGIFEVPAFNHTTPFYYTSTEYRRLIRREFERWIVDHNLDYVRNTTYDGTDPFTWNYSTAGIEGNYKGIYRRLYNTPRPHSHPWEIAGYSIEPEWWRTTYVPTSTETDGTPRYEDVHAMWTDLQNGLVHSPLGITKASFEMIAPIPVDASGELLDPISAGIVDDGVLDHSRLDDGWVFGDGGPIEENFYNSSAYPFAIALAGYLMRPLEWVATKWDDHYTNITSVFPGDMTIKKDTLVRSSMSEIDVHTVDGPVIGLNTWIVDKIKAIGIDPTTGLSQFIKSTTPNLAWKVYGFLNPLRTNYILLGGNEVPFEDAVVVTQRSYPTRTDFASGVYVAQEGTGYRVYGFDYGNPFFRIETPNIPVVGGMTEQRETFTAEKDQRTFVLTDLTLPSPGRSNDTSRYAVVINGLKMRSEFVSSPDNKTIVLDPSLQIYGGETVVVATLTTISNPSTMMKKFTVRGVDYFYFSDGSGKYIDVPYGTYFDSPSDVINFMVGYGMYLNTRGWKFDDLFEDVDSLDYVRGAKKFVTWLSEIRNPDLMRANRQEDFDSFYYSPFSEKAVYESTFGQLDTVEAIHNGLYGVINKRGESIPPTKLGVLKIGNGITITSEVPPVREGENEMYGIRVHTSEIQHVVFFSQTTKFNQVIYDPILGAYQPTMKIDTYKTNTWNGQYDAPGHILGDGVIYPNPEKQVADISRFYDRINPIDDPVKREQALNLYGYYPNDSYMDQIGADERSRFDYYRGMIHAKGTIRAVQAYGKGTRVGIANIFLLEDWVWRITSYGDQNRDEVQFHITSKDFVDRIQPIVFGTDASGRYLTVPDLDRTDSASNTRWILPSKVTDGLVSKFRFPFLNGEVDTRASMVLSLFNTETNQNIENYTYFDPVVGKFDRIASSLVDFKSYYDPALYNTGPKSASSDNLTWGPEQVGKTWWRQSLLKYVDYKGLMETSIEDASAQWGRLLWAYTVITQSGDTALYDLLDPVTRTPYAHNVPVGRAMMVTVRGANQETYNFSQIYVTATSPTQFSTQVPGITGDQTGNAVVQLGHVEVFEWVESPVTPDQWSQYTARLSDQNKVDGEPMFSTNPEQAPSYSVYERADQNGRISRKYYFWVKNYTGTVNDKLYPTNMIARRLSDPTQEGIPWFSPVSDSMMIVYTGSQKIKDTDGLSLTVDTRKNNTHDEWVLITEGDTTVNPPEIIESKIIDCLAQEDVLGNPVPDPYLIDQEIYGTGTYPPQTVFHDVDRGFSVWLTAVNKAFSRKTLRDEYTLTRLFKIADMYPDNVTGYWEKADFRMKEYEDKEVYEIVPTYELRDENLGAMHYFSGDVVRVLQSDRTDPWSLEQVYADYILDNNEWIEIGAQNQTIAIRSSLSENPFLLRRTYEDAKTLLLPSERNDVIFPVLYEMVRQSQDCTWFFKSSYLTMRVFDTFKQERYAHPNELDGIVNNILDVKPFHSKLREKAAVFSVKTEDVDEVTNEIDDSHVIWTTQVFDRLNSNLGDEYSWDNPYWDHESGWSNLFWELNDLGQDDWVVIGQDDGDTITTNYSYTVTSTPALYRQRLIMYTLDDDEEVNPADYNLSYTWLIGPKTVEIEYDAPIGLLLGFRIEQSVGFYEGEVSLNSPYGSTYYHQTARVIMNNDLAALSEIGDITDVNGAAPERAVTETKDYGAILVRDYSGSGERDFVIGIGQVPMILAGTEIFATSTQTTIVAETMLRGETGYVIGRVERQAGGVGPFVTLVLDTDYTITAGSIVDFILSLSAGDKINIVYSGFPVGKTGTFTVTSSPVSYSLENGILTLSSMTVGSTVVVEYLVDREGTAPTAVAVIPDYIVSEAVSNHLTYDDPLGSETNRPIGNRLLDTTTESIWEWSGTMWVETTLSGTKDIFCLVTGEVWHYTGGTLSQTYSLGDASSSPIYDYPEGGEGVGYGTEYYGTMPGAAIDHPVAYAIMQSTTLA